MCSFKQRKTKHVPRKVEVLIDIIKKKKRSILPKKMI